MNLIPTQSEMEDYVKGSGSADERFFGYRVLEDGLFLQQDPAEFSEFVRFLMEVSNRRGGFDLTLDLGIASGGQTKFVRDWVDCRATIILDDGRHSQFHHWERIRPTVRTEIVEEIIADSHSVAVWDGLQKYKNKIDFAFVDGDHSYRGLRKDIFLVTPLVKPWGILALHDTSADYDCARVHSDMLRSRNFVRLKSFDSRLGISVWLRVDRQKRQKWFNFRFGWGRL